MNDKPDRSFPELFPRLRRVSVRIPALGHLLVLALVLVPLWASGAPAQTDRPDTRRNSSSPATVPALTQHALPPFMSPLHPDSSRGADGPATASLFAVDLTARGALEELWSESKRENEERVACIAGEMQGGAFHVTRVEPVPTEKADSLRISPGPSLERCGPPEWVGTVHTHIATFNGQPFAMLSPSDRAVMNLWRTKWKQEGVFCVLYSESEAYCEYGTSLNDDVRYSPQRQDGGRR